MHQLHIAQPEGCVMATDTPECPFNNTNHCHYLARNQTLALRAAPDLGRWSLSPQRPPMTSLIIIKDRTEEENMKD